MKPAKESFNELFCVQLEHHLTRTFRKSTDTSTSGFWCDGIMMPFTESQLKKESVSDSRKIVTKAWCGFDGQTEYEMIINLGAFALERYGKGLDLAACLPGDDSMEWIRVDLDRKTIELQLA